MSVFDKLKKSNTTTKRKSNVQEIVIVEVEELCNQLIEASANLKNAEGQYENLKSQLHQEVKGIYSNSIKEGEPIKSFKLNGKITCIFTDKFQTVDDTLDQILQSKLTPEQYQKLFKPQAQLKLKDCVSKNEELVSELVGLLGDKLDKFFDTGLKVNCCNDFDKVCAIEGCYGEIEDIVEQLRYKPTIRI